MLEAQHRILDWRLENLQTSEGFAKMHQMPLMRALLPRRSNPLGPEEGRHRIQHELLQGMRHMRQRVSDQGDYDAALGEVSR